MLLSQSQLETYKKYQLILLVNLSVIVWVLLILSPELLSLNVQLLLLLVTVTIIGIPHGYFDFLVAKKLFSYSQNWLMKFIFVYLLMSFLYLYVWFLSPLLALLLFLLMALYHFGIEETQDIGINRMSLVISLGSLPVIAPILFQSEEVFYLFNILLNEEIIYPEIPSQFKYIYLIILIVIISIQCVRILPLYFLLIANFIFIPPLLSFILYFCFHHSIRHYLQSFSDSNLFTEKSSVKNFVIFFLTLTIFFSIGSIYLMSEILLFTLEQTVIKYIFITLPCLTLPHLILNIVYEHRISPLPLN